MYRDKSGFTIIAFLILISLTLVASADQTNDSDKYTFQNYGGEVYTPEPMEFGANLNGNESVILENGTERKHVYLQFYDNATDEQLLLLEEYGIQILNFAAYYTYVASMPADYTAADLPSESRLRWMGEIPVENKDLRGYGLSVPDYARLDDGKIILTIVFYEDVTAENALAVVTKHSNNYTTPGTDYSYVYDIIIDENNISNVIIEDAVHSYGYRNEETVNEDSFVDYEEIIEEDEPDIVDEQENYSQETVENINDSEEKESPGFTATIAIMVFALISILVKRK
ncbi:MAG: hypothetical protein PWQ75_2490 [Methanolobus sp.]|uniref:hypothetical protein n=1 Tax=Methanolobus sp. TaxID=1874737 RepID=UPI00258462EE|nr:hypothetical protein [Methanolobus sp.]MDK2832738.1 hypothetical protein [Methanolobus sp.]